MEDQNHGLGWIKVAQSSFQYFPRRRVWWLIIDYYHSLSIDATIMVSKKLSNHRWTRWYHFLQFLAKFKKKYMFMGFRATLNFRKFKVALKPIHIIFLKNFAESCGQKNDTNVLTSDRTVFCYREKSGNNEPSKSTSSKVLETVLSHLKVHLTQSFSLAKVKLWNTHKKNLPNFSVSDTFKGLRH